MRLALIIPLFLAILSFAEEIPQSVNDSSSAVAADSTAAATADSFTAAATADSTAAATAAVPASSATSVNATPDANVIVLSDEFSPDSPRAQKSAQNFISRNINLHRYLIIDLSFFTAMPLIEDSFNKLMFYGGEASILLGTSIGDFGTGISIGFGKNEGEDIRYDGIYHKGGQRSGGASPYFIYGYRLLDLPVLRFSPTIKLSRYEGHSGDDSIDVEDDIRKLYYYALGFRCEFTPNATYRGDTRRRGDDFDIIFATIVLGFDVNMHYTDVVAIKASIGIGIGLLE